MRTRKKIIDDIYILEGRKRDIEQQLKVLMKELVETSAALFEKEKKVKLGDPIKSEVSGITYFYDGFVESCRSVTMRVHPAKKDGTPSKAIRYVSPVNFGFDMDK